MSSTARRSAAVAAGASAAGLVAYGAGDRDARAAAVAAVAGAAATSFALGEDPSVRQAGFDQGYVQGQSDAIKRQYFLRHALETQPLPHAASGEGEPVYYVLPGPEVTIDGRKLAPHRVAVRVIE